MTEHVDLAIVLDCADPDALARFWSSALRYTTLGGAGAYVMLVPDGRPGPQLLLQRVPEPKAGKNRMHLDIHTADIAAEADRLTRLGARRVDDETRGEHGSHWIVMSDPEGNEFCICDGGGGC